MGIWIRFRKDKGEATHIQVSPQKRGNHSQAIQRNKNLGLVLPNFGGVRFKKNTRATHIPFLGGGSIPGTPGIPSRSSNQVLVSFLFQQLRRLRQLFRPRDKQQIEQRNFSTIVCYYYYIYMHGPACMGGYSFTYSLLYCISLHMVYIYIYMWTHHLGQYLTGKSVAKCDSEPNLFDACLKTNRTPPIHGVLNLCKHLLSQSQPVKMSPHLGHPSWMLWLLCAGRMRKSFPGKSLSDRKTHTVPRWGSRSARAGENLPSHFWVLC